MEDCYYFLYSRCNKGQSCKFRHCSSSRENPVLCRRWKQTRICDTGCPFRHSYYHLNKPRSEELCYWESATGCKKDFCEFKHRDARKDQWKAARVKTFEEIISQKEKARDEGCSAEDNMDETRHRGISDHEYLEEIDRELDEIDYLLDE